MKKEIKIDRLEAKTNKAWCVSIKGKKHWFPRHLCELYVFENIIRVPEWLAIEKDIV